MSNQEPSHPNSNPEANQRMLTQQSRDKTPLNPENPKNFDSKQKLSNQNVWSDFLKAIFAAGFEIARNGT
jgi:hypothetical protein